MIRRLIMHIRLRWLTWQCRRELDRRVEATTPDGDAYLDEVADSVARIAILRGRES